ncbi:MAG: sodium:solute symporter family protein [Limisphaerales bacterium]
MRLVQLDWLVIGGFFAIYLVIGLFVARSAGKSFRSYFLGDQRMPWWLLGFSMVATTFATDTPNLVTNIVRTEGVLGNWAWWAFLPSGMITVMFFARLWRRSGVLTDIEFNELRYSGKEAAVLRAFRAVYLGVFFNTIIMANVTLAAIKIGAIMFGLSPLQSILIAALITVAYSSAGGLTGVLLTDLIQFLVAMAGAVAAALFLVNLPEVGGWSNLIARPEVAKLLPVFPVPGETPWELALTAFLIPLAVQWWASYYPSAEPGGGGYVVQRVLAAKNERHAAGAALLFNLMHYAIRPWPWIVVALASVAVFPTLDSIRTQFPNVNPAIIGHDLAYPAMLTFLPSGLMGLVVASLIAAYMSTMSTQLNWGSSIIVNDLYHRFMKRDATERDLVRVGRWTTLAAMVLACVVALTLESALQAFQLLLQIGAGTGLIYILRWYWWRINATAEIVAMVASFLVAVGFHFAGGFGLKPAVQMLIGVGLTTAAWFITALVTKPTGEAKLREFYRRLQPGGPGWRAVVARARAEGVTLDDGARRDDFTVALGGVFAGLAGVYGVLFGLGAALYGHAGTAAAWFALAAVGWTAVAVLWRRLRFQ